MTAGQFLTVWTVRLALAGYALALFEELRGWDSARRMKRARWFWTFGCALMWIHVACAFQFHHHWSHAEAYADTARKTARLMGTEVGYGIYFNYVLLALWTADVIWWWCDPEMPQRRAPWIGWLVQGYLAFMVFNATIVFESGPTRWVGAIVAVALGTLWIARLRAPRSLGS